MSTQVEDILQQLDWNGDPHNPVVAKLTPDGKRIRSVKHRIKLDPERNEVWHMPVWDASAKKTKKVPFLTAAGYDRINQVLGVTFVAPDTLSGDDGTTTCNPHVVRDARGTIKLIRVRRVAIWRNNMGTTVVRDYVLDFDLEVYFLQDLFAKWRPKGEYEQRGWGQLLADSQPAPKAENRQQWIPFAVPAAGVGVSLWVDLSHADVIGMMNEHINRQKFAMRLAQTICERNLLKKATGITKLPSDLAVSVVAWPQADQTLTQTIADALSRSRGDGSLKQNVQYEQEHEVVDPLSRPEDQVVDAEVQDFRQVEGDYDEPDDPNGSVEPDDVGAGHVDPQSNNRALIRELVDKLGDEEAASVLGADGVELAEIGTCGVATLRTAYRVLTKAVSEKIRREAEANKQQQEGASGDELFSGASANTQAFKQ